MANESTYLIHSTMFLNVTLGCCLVALLLGLHLESKHQLNWMNKSKTRWGMLIGCMVIGILVRVIAFPTWPAGFNQDGALGAYDAFSLLRYGTDRFGSRWPAMLTGWNDMSSSPLLSWLQIPFMALLGLNRLSARLPMLICSILSMFVLYDWMCRMRMQTVARWSLFIVAINPWHIMQSRWALPDHLFPHFLLFSMYFLFRGITGQRWCWYISMLLFGLTMYSSPVAIYCIPILLLVLGIYCLYSHRISGLNLGIGCAVFALITWPIIATFVINLLKKQEVSLPFITLPSFTDPDFTKDNLFFSESIGKQLVANIHSFINTVVLQRPDRPWNTMDAYGALYPFALTFMIAGFLYVLWRLSDPFIEPPQELHFARPVSYHNRVNASKTANPIMSRRKRVQDNAERHAKSYDLEKINEYQATQEETTDKDRIYVEPLAQHTAAPSQPMAEPETPQVIDATDDEEKPKPVIPVSLDDPLGEETPTPIVPVNLDIETVHIDDLFETIHSEEPSTQAPVIPIDPAELIKPICPVKPEDPIQPTIHKPEQKVDEKPIESGHEHPSPESLSDTGVIFTPGSVPLENGRALPEVEKPKEETRVERAGHTKFLSKIAQWIDRIRTPGMRTVKSKRVHLQAMSDEQCAQLAPQASLLLICIWLGVALLTGLLINDVFVSSINVIWYPLLMLISLGIYAFSKRFKAIVLALFVLFAASFGCFTVDYFSHTEQEKLGTLFYDGFGEALIAGEHMDADSIMITSNVQYWGSYEVSEMLTLFHLQIDPAYYRNQPEAAKEGQLPFTKRYRIVDFQDVAFEFNPRVSAVYLMTENDYQIQQAQIRNWRIQQFKKYYLISPV